MQQGSLSNLCKNTQSPSVTPQDLAKIRLPKPHAVVQLVRVGQAPLEEAVRHIALGGEEGVPHGELTKQQRSLTNAVAPGVRGNIPHLVYSALAVRVINAAAMDQQQKRWQLLLRLQ